MVNEGVNAYLIESYFLKNTNISNNVYILGVNQETPLSSLPERDYIISAKPSLIVIGISYRDLTNDTRIYDDRFALISQVAQIPSESQYLFSHQQLELIQQSPFNHFLYNRKFIPSSLKNTIIRSFTNNNSDLNSDRQSIFAKNFKDPWIWKINKTESEKFELLKKADKYYISSENNTQKIAFLQMINQFRKNNISILLINMPLNPNYSVIINQSTRENYRNFLNMTGIPWYDGEHLYPSDYFTDNVHMNIAGRSDFSIVMAKQIKDHMNRGE
jgi:hypothetical protein